MGVYYSLSTDGYRWTILSDGKPWIKPAQEGMRMRDPFLTRGPRGDYHLVWTGWGKAPLRIGYAHSTDLIHWSQKPIPVLVNEPQTRNAWAPEIYYTEDRRRWVIIWSSTIPGRFPETDGQVESEMNHRIYSMTTEDFETFSEAKLFFDPGFPVIDATMLKAEGKYCLVFKDERRWPEHKQMRLATGPTLEGPWSGVSEPFTEPWTEGPSALKLKEGYVVYFDAYRRPQHFGAVLSKDLRTWTDITDKLSFSKGQKHGSFLRLSEQEHKRLQSASAPQ